ncbi:MAG: hypothetical protein ABJL87_20145 [Anderseniella sp.]
MTALADERIQVIKQRITTRDTILDLSRKFSLFSSGRKDMSITQLVASVRERIDIRLYDIGTRRRGGQNNAFTIAFIVGFEYEKPDIAAKVANELVTLILNEDVKTRTSRASETTNFLEREADRLQRTLVTVEQQIAQFKAENAGSLPSQQQFHLAALERAEQQKQSIARDVNAANDEIRFQEFELSIRSRGPTFASGQSGTPATGQLPLQQRLQILNAQLAEKLVVYSERHPDVKTLKGQIAAIEQQIADTPAPAPDTEEKPALSPDQLAKLDIQSRIVAEKIKAIRSRKELLIKQQDALTKQVNDLQGLLNRIPEVENGLAVLERTQESTRKALTEISDKLADARLGERLESDQQAERLQVIEQPVTPQDPVKPDRKKMLALGFALAIAAAGGAVLGLEALDSSVKGSSDLLSKVNKRPLVVLPYIRTRREQRLRILRIFSFVIVMVVLIVAGLAALHFLFMPLDILIPKVIERLKI